VSVNAVRPGPQTQRRVKLCSVFAWWGTRDLGVTLHSALQETQWGIMTLTGNPAQAEVEASGTTSLRPSTTMDAIHTGGGSLAKPRDV
jgi:hypothetical protein